MFAIETAFVLLEECRWNTRSEHLIYRIMIKLRVFYDIRLTVGHVREKQMKPKIEFSIWSGIEASCLDGSDDGRVGLFHWLTSITYSNFGKLNVSPCWQSSENREHNVHQAHQEYIVIRYLIYSISLSMAKRGFIHFVN